MDSLEYGILNTGVFWEVWIPDGDQAHLCLSLEDAAGQLEKLCNTGRTL